MRQGLPMVKATAALSTIEIVEVARVDYRTAGMLESHSLRSLDAIHLAVTLATEADFICTYDTRLVEAALAVGVPVLRPGWTPECDADTVGNAVGKTECHGRLA